MRNGLRYEQHKGKPVTIFANRPLPEETGEDDIAQQALNQFLRKENLIPTITIHRGHSYFANSTIGYMSPSSRIVFMGSCGGFPFNRCYFKEVAGCAYHRLQTNRYACRQQTFYTVADR